MVVTHWGSVSFDHKDVFRATEFSVTKRIGAGVRGVGAGVEWTKVERNRLGDALSNMNRWLKDALFGQCHGDLAPAGVGVAAPPVTGWSRSVREMRGDRVDGDVPGSRRWIRPVARRIGGSPGWV